MGFRYNPSIVLDGLVLYLDAANPKSYPGTGTTWYDLSGNGAHAIAESLPTFISNGPQSYFDFNGTSNEFASVDISQEYRDIFVLMNLSSTAPGLSMVFGKYDDQDDSLRFDSGSLRGSGTTDSNDWQYLQESKVFRNGVFTSASLDMRNQWSFLRAYRANITGFGTSFRYEISSSFISDTRHYKGGLSAIFCYNRELTNDEVQQNFNALRGRFGL